MIPSPSRYAETPIYDLLEAASKGHIGVDHRLVRTITERREESIPALVRWTSEDHDEAPVDLDPDLVDIFRYLRAPEAIPFLIDVLSAEPEDLPESLFEALYAVRKHAVEPLLDLYAGLEEEQSAEVAFLLASFRIRDPRILKLLKDRLEYDLPDGVMLLGLYGDLEALPMLEALQPELTGDDQKLKLDIGTAMEDLGRQLDDTPIDYNIWEDFPDEVGPRFDLMDQSIHLDLLTHELPELRSQAAAAFGARDYDSTVRERLLSVAKSDADPTVRGACWDALGSEREDPAIRAAMLQRLQDRDCPIEERAGALVGLAAESADKEIRPFAEELYSNPKTRAQAMKAMWASMDRSFSDFFPRHLDDPDEDVRRQAIWGIGYLAIYNSAEKLTAFFDQDELRPDALFAYALGVRYEISRGRIRGLFRRIDELSGGLSEEEVLLVQTALDERLLMHGQPAVFGTVALKNEEPEPETLPRPPKAGRNDPCPCGSGKKFKKCCGA